MNNLIYNLIIILHYLDEEPARRKDGFPRNAQRRVRFPCADACVKAEFLIHGSASSTQRVKEQRRWLMDMQMLYTVLM